MDLRVQGLASVDLVLADEMKEQSENAGISVEYVTSEEFTELAREKSGMDDPCFYNLKGRLCSPGFLMSAAVPMQCQCITKQEASAAMCRTPLEQGRCMITESNRLLPLRAGHLSSSANA